MTLVAFIVVVVVVVVVFVVVLFFALYFIRCHRCRRPRCCCCCCNIIVQNAKRCIYKYKGMHMKRNVRYSWFIFLTTMMAAAAMAMGEI